MIMHGAEQPPRRRARAVGIRIGHYPPGRFNAITDVPGVTVGHSTIIRGEGPLRAGEGPVRTGVTAILPHVGNVFDNRLVGSGFVLNGAGEVSGLTQVMEWGLIETPILLTNTMSVGTVSEAAAKYLVEHNPGIGAEHDVVIPLVGECDDSWLNDAAGRHVREEHVYRALESATAGPVIEGAVGGGTGMVTCDFKGGIGTSSRKLPQSEGGYTIGVLVMTNFGRMVDLRVDGVAVGEMLWPRYRALARRVDNYGSIITVVGTNAPLLPHQITRLCKRAAIGIGRAGSHAEHGSGEIVIGFSNANSVPRETRKMVYRMKVLLDRVIDPLYKATVEATQEAILNAMCAADTMTGHSGHTAPALPLDEVAELMRRYRPAPAAE
jgi:D-aminopeptidase